MASSLLTERLSRFRPTVDTKFHIDYDLVGEERPELPPLLARSAL